MVFEGPMGGAVSDVSYLLGKGDILFTVGRVIALWVKVVERLRVLIEGFTSDFVEGVKG